MSPQRTGAHQAREGDFLLGPEAGVGRPGSLEMLGGSLHVRPGMAPPHALQSGRQDWAGTLTRGREPAELPGLLASLFSLCGHAHRLCAQLALSAAAPASQAAPAQPGQLLRQETAQEHVRRIGLDWPRLLANAPDQLGAAASAEAAVKSLQTCPLLKAGQAQEPWAPTLQWLQQELLHMPAVTWLRAWQACGADWLLDWSQRHAGWLPTLLRHTREADTPGPLDMGLALRVHHDPTALRALSAALAIKPGFGQQPQWRGACAHTGPWARRNATDEGLSLSPWSMLGSRLAELVRLCLPEEGGYGGATSLSFGALQTAPGQALAWVEMARGLLIHQVELSDASEAESQKVKVQACRVIAPTEWNFHPQGEVAQRIAALDKDLPAQRQLRQVGLLMAAFDPCVPFRVQTEQAAQLAQTQDA